MAGGGTGAPQCSHSDDGQDCCCLRFLEVTYMPASDLCSWSPGSYGSAGGAHGARARAVSSCQLRGRHGHGFTQLILDCTDLNTTDFRLQPSSRKLNMQVTGTFFRSGRRDIIDGRGLRRASNAYSRELYQGLPLVWPPMLFLSSVYLSYPLPRESRVTRLMALAPT